MPVVMHLAEVVDGETTFLLPPPQVVKKVRHHRLNILQDDFLSGITIKWLSVNVSSCECCVTGKTEESCTFFSFASRG